MTSSIFDLTGRVALLTGATGYLGSTVAEGLCQAGATVLLNSRSTDRATQIKERLEAQGWSAETSVFDINNDEERLVAIRSIEKRHGRIDVLINNAFSVVSPEGAAAFDSAYKSAVTSAWQLTHEALELLKAAAKQNGRGGASVINIASMYGIVSPDFRIYSTITPRNPVYYGPAKAALIQLTRYLACELGPRRIRVNAVSPGPFPNPKVCQADPEFIERLAKKNPLGRIGNPGELVGPIVFLASNAASYVTGINLEVDGGWVAW